MILTTLLYGCETWTVYQRGARKLDNFHTTSLLKLQSIKCQEKIPDTEVLTFPASSQCSKNHSSAGQDTQYVWQTIYSSRNYFLARYKKESGAPEKRFKDSLKASQKTFTTDHDSWEAEAQDRCRWRAAVYEGAKRSETRGTHAAEQGRHARKDSAKSSAAAAIPCPHRPRLFQARMGWTSQLGTPLTNQPPPSSPPPRK